MADRFPRGVRAPLSLLGLTVGAYFLVLGGIVPAPPGADATLLVLAGATTITAAIIRAKLPALTAGAATLGFALGLVSDPLLGNIAATLAILGCLGFLVSTTHVARKRYTTTNPT